MSRKAIGHILAALATAALPACNKGQEPQVDDCIAVTAPVLVDGTQMDWQKGDIIAVSYATAESGIYTLVATESGHTARFRGDVPKDMKEFKAFYPYSAVKRNSGGTNFEFVLNQVQKAGTTADMPSVFPLVCFGEDIHAGFAMKPVSGLLKIRLSGKDIKSVTLSVGSTSTDYISSQSAVVNARTLNTSIKTSDAENRTVKLLPRGASSFSPGEYSFGIIGKTEPRTITGYTLNYAKTDGSSVTRNFPGVLSIEAGKVVMVEGDETSIAYNSTFVSGKVYDSNSGKGIPGVLVSDGVQFAGTAQDGTYSFTSDLGKSQCVFVIMPSEYEFGKNVYGGWSDYVLLDRYKSSQTVDFALTKRRLSGDRYRILIIGDPQQMSTRAHSAPSWQYVCSQIDQYRRTIPVPAYLLSVGDMVTNEIEVPGMAEAYLATQSKAGLCTFCVPGNHDHVQDAGTYYASVSEYCKWFGPWNYSMNLGKHHFVFLDDLAWCVPSESRTYSYGLNDLAINYLEKDLSYVDPDTPVHIVAHVPMTKSTNGSFPVSLNEDRLFAALSGRKVEMWYGHLHNNVNSNYTQEELDARAPGVKSLGSHLVSRCGGNWSCSGEVNHDGSPRGFVELDLDGTSCMWRFHSIDPNYDNDMNVYMPGQFKGELLKDVDDKALYCNVYCWQNDWNLPEIWAGGKKVGNMSQVKIAENSSFDPLYQHFYPIWKAQGLLEQRDEPPKSTDNSHLFKYIPAQGTSSLQIRVRDRWGTEHIKDIILK